MLSRIISIHSRAQFRLISHIFSPSNTPKLPFYPHSNTPKLPFYPSPFSTGSNGDGGKNGPNPNSDIWKISQENDSVEDIFGDLSPDESKKAKGSDDLDDVFGSRVEKIGNEEKDEWALGDGDGGGGVFDEFLEAKSGDGGDGGGVERREDEVWKLGGEEGDGKVDDLFGIEDETGFRGDQVDDDKIREEREMIEKLKLSKEEQSLLEIIKGPDRAFGDLVAASGITDAMLDSLIALKNFQDIEGLPPLKKIEDDRHLKTLMKSSRYEMEIQKQEDAAKARVRKVDDKGRAYGTGKRKCSIARVWIQPGEGQFSINDKEFDVYFPMLDHRAALLRPFSETKTLGLWDVNCTVKGGGTTGQVGAIRLGISRALQNWEPGLRPPLKEAGFLTRDPRIVERKKPGKAKARKSFQWVKR